MSWLGRFDPGSIQIVYEAGPTGFGLVRHLRENGIDCSVAAPSKPVRARGDHVKTDKRDAPGLARILSLGQVTEVRVPSEEQEALRDLSQARLAAAKDLAHCRQRINALLLRHGIHYPEKTRWTGVHLAWPGRQRFTHTGTRLTLEADLDLQVLLLRHLKRLQSEITEQARQCEYAAAISALMCFRGIDITTAYGLAVQIGDWTRFTGSSIGSYLGLVPSEHSSGMTRPQGSITKAGDSYARRLLIEAAWQHDRPFKQPGGRLLGQLQLVDSPTRIRALEGNRRPHRAWDRFGARGKMRTKANTAIARELAGWCWSVAAPLQEAAKAVPAFEGAAMNAA